MRQINDKFNIWNVMKIYFYCTPITTLIICVLKVCLSLLPFLTVLFGAKFIDCVLEKSFFGYQSAMFYSVALCVSMLFQRLGGNLESLLYTRQRVFAFPYIERILTEKIAFAEYSCIENHDTQDLLLRTTQDPEGLLSGVAGSYLSLVEFLISNASLAVLLVTQAPFWISPIIIVLLILFGYFALKAGEKEYSAQIEVTMGKRKANYYEEILGSREAVNERMLFGYAEKINSFFQNENQKARKREQKARFRWFIFMNAGGYMAIFISILVILSLVSPVLNGKTSVGIFISLITAFMSMAQNITWQLPEVVKKISEGRLLLQDFNTVLHLPDYRKLSNDQIKQAADFVSLEFSHVSFRYPGTEIMVLKDISFKIEKGLHYAFVGKNGCGKSTIVKLILCLYEPDEGNIFLNGIDIRQYDREQIWSIFAAMFQDYARYPISLYDNIALGRRNYEDKEAGKKEILQIAADENLMPLIDGLSNGIFTNLGKALEAAVDVSGGQWQRIAMARVHYSKAALKILDEPTAAIDPVQEQKIYQRFLQQYQETTTIMITHRLGATSLCDHIFVIEDGRVTEQGSHEDLMKKQQMYYTMYEQQRRWYL